MSTTITPPAETKPAPFDFSKFQADRAAGKTSEAKPADAAVAEPPAEKRASGDERKFRRLLSKRDQEIGELRAKLEALTPKEQAKVEAAARSDAAPSRADFATDELYEDARITFLAEAATKKTLDAKAAEEGQSKEVKAAIDGYNERMARGPQKYDDWAEVLAAGSGAALNVDLSKECPALFWAITKSPYNDDCFYHWLKDSSKLQALIDQYKQDPQQAIAAFHRFEGRVGKDEIPAKKEEAKPAVKAEDAGSKAKPKPSSEVQARAGKAAPDGPPPVTLGDGTLNPAWKAHRAQQERRN